MKLARELQNAIATGELAPVSLVSVPPETEHQLFILFTPSSTFRDHIKGIPKKQDARIFLRLVDFDQEAVKNNPQFHALLNNDVSQIPLREIMVRSSLVRSIMDLGQNNINFGTMEKGEKRTKTIVIQNRSKEPLLYHIRKSGSIASGDIVLGTGKSGVVRGYSKKEVDFIFEPSMSGQYHEKLAIENIQDPESSRVLNVKANIRKPEHFSIEVSELDFGSTSIGKKSEPQRVVITNSTKQSRSFEVRVDPREMALLSTEAPVGGQIEFTLEDEAGKAIVTKEMEDEIEILEQKLKIAKRKGRHDKVLKVTARLSLLRKGGVEDKEEPSKAADNSETTLTSDKVQELDKLDQGGSPMAESSAKGTSNSTPTSTAVSTPTAKEGPKFRKTDHSIVFTLEGGKTKSVTAYFTPLQDPASSGIDISNFGQLGLQGKIFVHEHKNRDVYREITFVSKTDCQTMAPDTNPDVNEVPDPTKSEVEQPKEKVERNGDAVKDTTVAQDITVQPSECTSEATQTSEPKHPENLVTSPCELDGGRLEQGHNGTFYFKLSNLSDGPQPYRIELEERPGVEHRVKFEEDMLEGTLEPKEDRRISFGYQAADVGRLYDTLRVVNPLTQTAFDFKFSIYSHRSQYLAFPSLDESMQLDLGHCYVDTGRKYSQVTPLLIENVTDDDVYIACASNLSQQVGIFQDEQAEKGQVSRTLLKKRSMITVWVAVQPNLLGDVLRGNTNRRPAGAVSNTHGSGNNDRDSECRTLVGGIKFSISVQEESVTANEPKSDQMDRSRIWISFRVTVSTPGLFTDTILVTNKNNCSQKIEIKVRLFVDPKYLLSTAHGPGYVCPMAMDEAVEVQDERHGASREGLCLPRFTWKDVYVNVHEDRPAEGEGSQIYVALQPTSGESEANVERRWIEFTNDSDAPMELVPLCDTGVETRWASETPQEGTEELLTTAEDKAVEGFQFCGQVLRVNPSESAQLLVTCPAPDLDANALELLQCGKNATLNGNLMVMDRLKNQIVKVLSLAATFGISYSEIHPLTSELGKIGHYNSWKPVSAFFEVRNSSEVPLQYEVILQDCMELIEAPTEEDGEPTQDPELRQRPSTKRTISSQNLDKIGVTLYPKRVDNFEIGRRSFPIQVVNLNNPENVLVFTVSALLTEFELGFDRLSGGKLVLPPLTHPLPSGALPCDAWFTITNKSPEDVKFEIGATLSPDIENYVRLEVLSRFSNSPLRGNISLSPRGSIEVRIRAFSREDSRLPSNTAALCTPDGLTFGSLWVATKSTTSEDEPMAMRYAEDIPIRGTLVEGSMFTLSTQRIVFKSLLEASDSEGESDNERLSVPDTLPSREPCDDDINPEIQQAFISITNLSTCFPLDFQLTLEGPMEYPAAEIIKVTPLDANNCGSVEPGQQLKLMVELIDPHVIISEDIKLYIRNLNSKMGQQQRVVISIVSDNREHRKPGKKHVAEDERVDPHHHQNKLDEPVVAGTIGPVFPTQTAVDSDSGTMQPVISLRGCKRMDSSDSPGGRYELDLGQQDMGSPNVLRKLVLENHGFDRVSYRIKTISALDKNWLKVSRFDGTLEPPSYEPLPGGTKSGSSSTNTITLSFSTNVRNVYSTYLLVENVDNPADTKTIRVTMEIVARQNIRRSAKALEADNKVFNVFVNGVDYKNTSSIDMKNLYYGSEYTARSMVVYNREAVPMEFTFKSNLSPSDATEILFSTSRTSAKLFKTLTVPPENHVRIYIRFFPKPSAAIKAALDNGEYRDPNEMELKTVEIYINCRLVKDYQHVVVLKAECYLPALRVDWQDSVSFVARLSRKPTTTQESSDEWQITFREDYRILGIQNLLNMPLEYQIVNDTMYFTLEYTELDKVVDGMQLHHIRIVPNVKALLRNAENFRKEKYVQENITIYNRRRPLENYWIPLRLSFGNVSNFQLSSGYKSSYAFGMIEQHVVNFLSDFNSHAVLVNMGNTTGSALADAHSNIGLGPDRNVQLPTANNLSPSSSGPLVAGMLGLGRAGGVYGPPPQHQHHAHLQATEALDAQRKLIDLEFQYHYVVDQLVYYSTIKTGENFFQLAGLLFCSLLSNRIFQIWSPAYLKDPRTNESATGTAAGGAGAASGTSGATGLGPDSDDPQPQPQPQQQQTQQQQQSQQQQQPGANGVTTASHARLPQDGEQVIRVWPESLRKWVEALDYFVSFFPYHSRQLETLKALHHSLISS
ncbi:hypothetical protein BGW38_010705 [Lunasporangiospora selenospora]|uniref:Uncharacterized protein n=1 Tax=Lunasporangiospora selenospora TaxID=979761 RepID=A0A9P6G2R5_9FUNG|nr:hypothetical protein BGW38_010705 [Lunasporangiospora selenospora]